MSTFVVQNSFMDERITRAEAARRLGVSYQTIVRMVRRGQLREWSNDSGTIHRLSSSEVDALLKEK